jgi:small-conductance mechanosensitive channel
MFEIKPDEDQPNLVIVELLGLIDKMANSNHRLEAVLKEYQAMVHALREQGGRLVDQRDRARSVAATLEAECANCWGPIHKDALEQVQALHRIEEATDGA